MQTADYQKTNPTSLSISSKPFWSLMPQTLSATKHILPQMKLTTTTQNGECHTGHLWNDLIMPEMMDYNLKLKTI